MLTTWRIRAPVLTHMAPRHLPYDKASPAYWLMFAALCALCSTLALYHRANTRGQVMQEAAQ